MIFAELDSDLADKNLQKRDLRLRLRQVTGHSCLLHIDRVICEPKTLAGVKRKKKTMYASYYWFSDWNLFDEAFVTALGTIESTLEYAKSFYLFTGHDLEELEPTRKSAIVVVRLSDQAKENCC